MKKTYRRKKNKSGKILSKMIPTERQWREW